MINQLEILNRLYDGIKFKDAEYTEKTNTCVVNFLYNPQVFTPNEEKNKTILNKVEEIVGNFVKLKLNLIACPLDRRVIANHAYSTIINSFPALSKNFTYDDVTIEINGLIVTVNLMLNQSSYNYAIENSRDELIANKLKESFLADFKVKFIKRGDEVVSNVIESNAEFMHSIKEAEEKTVYKLSEVHNIIGSTDYVLAADYSKINSAVENIVICGEITNVERKTYKRQQKHNGESTEIERAFFSFALKNEGKIMYCSLFPKQAEESKFNMLEVGMRVCCFGSFRMFNNRVNYTANYCKL